ncbi:MAG: carboxypeptidase-like regulatory domain-containing protein [Alphaproteobacteria bacterium]|nr:carboxypeptidase-like regulatory domain-containing protein [Alphaproteobacteria bacterium]
MKPWKQSVFSILCQVAVVDVAVAEVLLLEPRIQGYDSDAVVHAVDMNGVYFLDIQDMAESLRFDFSADTGRGQFLGREFQIASGDISGHLVLGGGDFYSIDFYEKLLPLRLGVNVLEMQLDVDSDAVLPTTRGVQNAARRRDMMAAPVADPFSNYDFDNRMFTFPIVDFIYRRTQNFNQIHRDGYSRQNGNFYQANMAMIFAGLDSQVTLFGDDYGANKLGRPGARMTVGRTMLDGADNFLNLVRFQAGDIVSAGNNLFYNGVSGRGVLFSSFKDLVVSADKTIDITGPMPAGWDAELYLNNQLIGFRQSGLDGRYEFKNIPVNYGLNDFKVVLYGPYGEVREEQRRFYSGTSPVRAGEFGYDISAQQPNRFIINDDYSLLPPSDQIVANSLFYYGISDRLTLMGGLARAQSPSELDHMAQYSTLGGQLSLNGVSVQYNANYNMDNNAIGHHIDAQGDIYVGTIFARYEHYGNTRTPVSYFLDGYLTDLFEGRLTGALPWIHVPYYVAYAHRESENGNTYREIHARLSPNFMRYYNVTLENVWRKNGDDAENYIGILAQATYGRMRANGRVQYQTVPENYLHDYGMFAEYRWDKNTYVQASWNHDCRSNYAHGADMDAFGIGIGRLFKFGGLTFNVSADTDRNLSLGLTYNISVGKIPDSARFFANAENQMMNYGTIFARATDADGRPVANVRLVAAGRESASFTDQNGTALITNMEPYQKSTLVVDETDVDDISLVPQWNMKKLVLRPGVIRPVDIVFQRLGGVEGQLTNIAPGGRYRVWVRHDDGRVARVKNADADGAFIFDGLPYGEYVIEITDGGGQLLQRRAITIDRAFDTIGVAFDVQKRLDLE